MTVTIQKTGKFWKLLLVVSLCALMWGAVDIWQTMAEENARRQSSAPYTGEMNVNGFVAVIGGLAGIVLAKIGAWWFHG